MEKIMEGIFGKTTYGDRRYILKSHNRGERVGKNINGYKRRLIERT